MTPTAIQTALLNPTAGMTSAVNDWLLQHHTLLQLVQIFDWAANHPIISFVLFLFGLTLVWNIIKAFMALIEKASWSILQIPLKLIQSVLKLGFFSILQVFNLLIKKSAQQQVAPKPIVMVSAEQEKQQRLAEISLRLQAIQQEQHELLQEAANLMNTDNVALKVSEVIPVHNSKVKNQN